MACPDTKSSAVVWGRGLHTGSVWGWESSTSSKIISDRQCIGSSECGDSASGVVCFLRIWVCYNLFTIKIQFFTVPLAKLTSLTTAWNFWRIPAERLTRSSLVSAFSSDNRFRSILSNLSRDKLWIVL